EVDRIVEAWTRERSKREVFDDMIAADVPCGMVMDIEEVLNDEAIGWIQRIAAEDFDVYGYSREVPACT
ncbi:hypothetical protein LCGC14_2990740, partial [marine sediment metagenome]